MKNAEITHKTNYNLLPYNTLRISSLAEDVYFPSAISEFTLLLANLESPIVIGRGSNILLSSAGVKTPVVITRHLDKIEVNPPYIEAEAGVSTAKLSQIALELKLKGFEFLNCIPASLGGAVSMNAGAGEQSVSDYFQSALIYDSLEDKIKCFLKEEMEFSYRNSILKNQSRYFLLSAKFCLDEAENYDIIQKKMDEHLQKRKESQPDLKEPNLGCTFKNPVIDNKTVSAGKLIDECGLKSYFLGGAMVSRLHANFIINFNNATSLDYLCLMKKIQDDVIKKFDIKLYPEILYFGDDKREADLWKSLTQK